MPDLSKQAAVAPSEVGAIPGERKGTQGKLGGLVPKMVSYLHHLRRIERGPWAIAVGAGFGVALAIGHVIGGVSGLFHGYEHVAKIWLGEGPNSGHSLGNPDKQLNSPVPAIANELRSEFARARDKLEQTGVNDFSRAEEALLSLRRIDEQIGHVWYFEGEIRRLKNPAMFTSKSCLKELRFGQTQISDSYHQDFYRYLEIASSLPARDTDGDAGSEVCYHRSNGYCIQRTAWIHHLLANDFYQMAIAAADDLDREPSLEQARKHANAARRYRSPEGLEGFVQCIGTVLLEQKITAQFEAIRKPK
jgi:hypothetical protein